ncbi:MAG: response regulator [Deltaproteobacteria bacterium]|nr:response regulator [Deltaproteobacteria bacterium]
MAYARRGLLSSELQTIVDANAAALQMIGAQREAVIGHICHKFICILLAEDDPTNQKVAVNMLKKQGHWVTVADNGESALKMARDMAFDLILMDVQMPVMDGLTATAEIRCSERGNRRRSRNGPNLRQPSRCAH